MFTEKQIATAERRYNDCLRIHRASKKGTWAYDFWLQTANAIKRNSDVQRQNISFLGSGYFNNEK